MQARKNEHEDSIYQMIVMHSVLTVLVNKKTKHIKLLSNFLSSPEALKVCTQYIIMSLYPSIKDFLLPAMPIEFSGMKEEEERFLRKNINIICITLYFLFHDSECINGHQYTDIMVHNNYR